MYNIIYVGFGPATIFSLLEFLPKNSLVLEKGLSLKKRPLSETLYGSGGAGAYSDNKLVANPIVGGDIKNAITISDNDFYTKANTILDVCNSMYVGTPYYKPFKWLWEDNYEIPSKKLKLLKSKVCHIGTDKSREIFLKIEKFLSKKIKIQFNEEVLEIKSLVGGVFEIKTTKKTYFTRKVVIGVGKRSALVQTIIKEWGLSSRSNLIQMGVRVEAPSTYFRILIDKFYDFKIVMNTPLGRWRTFCVCAKNAQVAVERGGGFVSANGHASSGNNGLINFGVMGELHLGWDRVKQVQEMQKINNNSNKLLAQNITDFLRRQPSEKLNSLTSVKEENYRIDNLWKYYQLDILEELSDFLREIKNHFELEGHFFAPEIKLTNPLIEMDQFQVVPGMYLIGDCSGYSRSIIQAGIIGMLVGKKLANIM